METLGELDRDGIKKKRLAWRRRDIRQEMKEEQQKQRLVKRELFALKD